jgi:hypothetical protein
LRTSLTSLLILSLPPTEVTDTFRSSSCLGKSSLAVARTMK